jgi:hypothetical protein
MKKAIRAMASLSALAGMALMGVGCGGESGGSGTGPVDNFLPLISNFYRNVSAQAHTLTLQSAQDGQATGSFVGIEAHPTLGVANPVSGTFTNSTSTINIARTGGTVTYSGKFLSRDTLRLTRTGETLTFAK